jgi:hypothetical protein
MQLSYLINIIWLPFFLRYHVPKDQTFLFYVWKLIALWSPSLILNVQSSLYIYIQSANNFVSFLDCQQLQVFKWVSGRKTLIILCAFTIICSTNKKAPLPFGKPFFLIILFFLQNPYVYPYIVLINGVETYTKWNNIICKILFWRLRLY